MVTVSKDRIALVLYGLLWTAALGFWAARLRAEMKRAPVNATSVYRRVDWWVLSARCTQLTGTFLTVCGNKGELYPIEDIAPMDDRGHTLLANIRARFQSKPFEKVDLVRINLAINAVGILVLSVMLLLSGMPVAALFCIYGGTRYGIPGPVPSADAMASFLGEYCLALAPVVWLPVFFRQSLSRWRAVTGCVISFFALAWAMPLREALGLVGVVAAIGILVVLFVSSGKRNSQTLIRYGIALVCVVCTLRITTGLLALRNHLWPVKPAVLVESHGVAHAFYQGLGWGDNPWGIHYGRDEEGYHAAARVDPQTGFATKGYFKTIRGVYLKILIQQPWEVLRVYKAKLFETLRAPFHLWGISAYWTLAACLILLPLLFYRAPSETRPPVRIGLAITLANFVLLSEGVFIRPDPPYIYPVKIGIALAAACLGDWILRFAIQAGGVSKPFVSRTR